MTRIKVVDIQNTKKQTNKHAGWKKLSDLLGKINRLQARNQRLEQRIAQFFDEFAKQVKTHESQMAQMLDARIRCFIGFIPRRTIKGACRTMLYDLIENDLDSLDSNPFWMQSTGELKALFYEQIKKYEGSPSKEENAVPTDEEVKAFRDQVRAMFGIEIDVDDSMIAEMMQTPEKLKDYLYELKKKQSTTQHQEDEAESRSDFYGSEHEEPDSYFEQPAVEDIDMLFKDSELNKLYKKMATKLHPDKENDDALKDEKKALMQQLSTAKEEGDIFTLLQMAEKWLPDFEIDLSTKALKSMLRVLEAKVRRLNLEHRYLNSEDDVKTFVWRNFSAHSKKQQNKNIQEHIQSLKERCADFQDDIDRFKTVKAMNSFLRENLEIARMAELEFRRMLFASSVSET